MRVYPLHKYSEKACMCFLTRRVRTRNFMVHRVWRRIQRNPKFLQSIGSNYELYGDEPQLGVNEFITAR